MVKFIFFLIQLFILLFFVTYLSSNSFEVAFEIKQLKYTFSSNLLLFSIVLISFLIFIIQLIYFRSQYKFKKYFLNKKTKNLEQGYNFFVQAMIAIANKDNKTAIQANNKMKKLIGNEDDLSLLLNSEIFKIERKYEKLELVHQQMIKNKNTKTLGYKGLMEQNLKNQDYHHAFIYGERLFELNPNIEKIYPTLVNIIAKTKNWNQLILITNKAYNKKLIGIDVANKNNSIAFYEISKIKMYSQPNEALKLILKAIKLNKSFPPFIKLQLDILYHLGDVSNLIKILRKYWNESPSSSLRNIMSIFLKESKLDNIENVKSVIKNTSNEIESKKLILEFAIHNSNWSLARENIVGLINNNPDREMCELMALLELGEFSDKQKSDAWYLRAQNSNLNKIWICKNTNTSQTKWTSVSESGYFNSLEWRQPKMLGLNF
jgi:HemY protein